MRRIVEAIKSRIKKSGLLPSFTVRERLAAKYLRGTGLEIGALHFPLKVPDGVIVKYVDYSTREQNVSRFPELAASEIVETDYLENGFELASFPQSSQDFIIGNHVLEHAGNPIQVLLNWGRLLRPEGVLMVTVPVMDRCFDKGRQLTTLEHFVEDHRLLQKGEIAKFKERNLHHFAEIIQISEPNIRSKGGRVPEVSEAYLRERLLQMAAAEQLDLHYTFSIDSFRDLMEYFVKYIGPDFSIIALRRSRGGAEVVAILKKKLN
jgi:SAM-dependent methyltransferase